MKWLFNMLMFETLLKQRAWRGSSNGCCCCCCCCGGYFASASLCCIVTSIDLPPKFGVSLFALTGIAMETQGREITVKLRGKLYQGASPADCEGLVKFETKGSTTSSLSGAERTTASHKVPECSFSLLHVSEKQGKFHLNFYISCIQSARQQHFLSMTVIRYMRLFPQT